MSPQSARSIRPDLAEERRLASLRSGPVIGLDEVGRGALAGPVAVGAVVVDPHPDAVPTGLRDSKLLSPPARERLVPPCVRWALFHAVGFATVAEIDRDGITGALGIAACRALDCLAACGLPSGPAVLLLDGAFDWITPALERWESAEAEGRLPGPCTVVTRVRADRHCASVAAASVLAKVRRDALMSTLAVQDPRYGWAENKGYGTLRHRQALQRHGTTPWHRRGWWHPSAAPGPDSA